MRRINSDRANSFPIRWFGSAAIAPNASQNCRRIQALISPKVEPKQTEIHGEAMGMPWASTEIRQCGWPPAADGSCGPGANDWLLKGGEIGCWMTMNACLVT